MALDIQRMMMQLQPARPLDFGGGGSSMERERLRLAREQLEFQKKQNEEDKELRRIEEQGRNTRAELERQEALRKEEEQRKATLLAQQQAQLQKFGEAAGTGKVQQAQAMAPLMDQLGYDVNTLGNVGGLPVFQLMNRAQEAERAATALPPPGMNETAEQSLQRLQSGDIGYPTNERGTLDDPNARRAPTLTDDQVSFEPGAEVDETTADALSPGDADMATAEQYGGDAEVSVGRGMVPASLSQGDAFAQALAASQTARVTGKPARGPDEEDFMGAVPRNVIDLPAMQAETLARLNPALKARVEALPEELQQGAAANAKAIGGLGLEASDALKEMDTALQDPVSIYNSQQNLLAEKEKRNTPSMMDISTYRVRGAERLQKLAEKRGVNGVLGAVKSADIALSVLDDDDPNNDTMIAPALMDAQGVKGVPSNTDLAYSLGMSKASTLTQIISFIEEKLAGGMSTDQKKAIKSYLKSVQESQKGTVNDYLNNAVGVLDSGELNEHEARGYKGALEESIPAWMYNEYFDAREKSGGKRGAGKNAPVDAGDLDSEKLGRVIGHESQGDATATSVAGASGTMQIMPENLRAMGIEPEDFKKLSPEEQMPYNIRYLKERGITKDSSAEDYAMAVAAPAPELRNASNDTVVYPKGSKAWEQNPGWRPADGGDITKGSILKFYGLGGEKSAEKAPAKAEASGLPEAKTPAQKRILELLKKRDG